MIDPSAFTCSRLAGELADEWLELAAAARWSHSAVRQARRAVEVFCAFVDGTEPRAAEASLAGGPVDLARAARVWSRSLPGLHPVGSRTPAVQSGLVRRLIARRGEHGGRRVADTCLAWASAPNGLHRGASRELDEFTRSEKAALLAAAWSDLRVVEKRIQEGWLRAERGTDPEVGGFLEVDNLLWAIANNSMTLKEIRRRLPDRADWPAVLGELVPSQYPPGTQWLALMHCLVNQLFPSLMDLHCFRILLMAATNAAPEEITGLTAEDVEFQPGGVLLSLRKDRAHRIRRAVFGQADPSGVLVPALGPRLNAADLLRRLQKLTAPLATRAGLEPAPLFLRASVRPEAVVNIAAFNGNIKGRDLRSWTRRAGLTLSEPVDIRRLRKSGKVEKAIAFGGRVSDIADDHSVEVFRGHYAHGTTLHVISGNVITSAQQFWLDKALSNPGPLLLTEQAESSLAAPEATTALGLTRSQVEDLRSGALDMGVSSCRDPQDSPYAAPGQLCPVAPLRCLECRNAFILPSNLPQLLLFADHLDRLALRLDPGHFARLWGQSRVNLSSALAERTDAELELARKQIARDGLRLQLPLASQVEFDG
ncbi:hypothetical protein ACFV4M_02060 [Kitasatospora indigofera]|uniref:hypothetical protein n=1 Tax=Kitasatospora indigofera TaxID=67307 RepID=UPI003658AD97